ncbi:MAG TPA: helix-turn-helix transcriptional regulator [Candidatus Dormibacteraeota bacterium]|nr:helix-turn-helix transcriptional regulator [Candidatus Dormibacteraeota bacterium]
MTDKQIKQIIGKNLQDSRKKVRLTQLEVANVVDINVNYYAKIEQGLAIPSLLTLEKILKAINAKSSKILPF